MTTAGLPEAGESEADDATGGPSVPPPFRPNRDLIGYIERGQRLPDSMKEQMRQ